MKIRSITQLNEFLSQDLTWRKRELTATKLLISRSRNHEQEMLLRAGVCMLYAHWEGFVKNAATAYLNFVARQGLKLCNLSPSLVALCLRDRLRGMEASRRISIHTELTVLLLSDLQQSEALPWADAVDTGANLNFAALQEILCLLGLQHAQYALKKAIIDEKLLAYRHSVAHGEHVVPNFADYQDLHNEIIALVELFRNDVENAAVTGLFRR